MQRNRIAFVGKAGTGKTTAAIYLRKYRFNKIAMADKIKEICKDLWPDQFKNGNKPRKLLQRIGTEGIRSYDPDVWVNYIIRHINSSSYRKRINWVVDDCRFKNEADILRKNDFIIVKIIGPQRTEMPEGTASHSSETDQDSIEPHYVIYNNGSLENFYKKIEKLVSIYVII